VDKKHFDENWYWYLTGETKDGFSPGYARFMKTMRRTFGLIPGGPRCFECNRPMARPFNWLSKAYPSSFSPKLCDSCERYTRQQEAGAEVEMSILFADVRGSTALAEQRSPTDFMEVIQRFYKATAAVLVEHNAMVNRLMGDQVIGLFVPRFAGTGHAQVAVAAALDLLHATGHDDPGGPWVPVGIGVHTGLTYVGAVGSKEGVNEIAVLGNAPNLAARLSSQAAEGEVLVSEAAVTSGGLATEGIESRMLNLKGISGPVAVRVLRTGSKPVLPAKVAHPTT
jgi:adenylate cyclase